jgi:threonine synthase
MLANYSGLPVQHFIAACNANNAIPEYLKDGHYQPKPSVATISNAMDVGNPSNFIRMLQLVKSNLPALKNKLSSYSITDAETKEAIKDVYLDTNYLLDPHGAVGYCGSKKYLSHHPEQRGIFLETAHPIKFYDVVEPIINKKIELPQSIIQLLNREKKSIKIKKDFDALKAILNERGL